MRLSIPASLVVAVLLGWLCGVTNAGGVISRPEGSGGYPGFLFPWSSGGNCPDGYDFCGVLEFCMGEYSFETGLTYGYRLPCLEDECECQSIGGPIIRVEPGKVYRLTLRNAGTETTNLHVHGLHISGEGNSNDVTRQVETGHCLDYTWDIRWDHPGGTYWYHAHHHGMSEKQVGGGAFGMFIVEDNTYENGDQALPSWTTNERLLQVSVMSYTDEIFGNWKKDEIIDIAAKQWYRLRVSLASTNAVPYDFIFDDQGMCDIHKVASDGIWRSVVPGPKSSVWELTGASRADFAIRCDTPEVLIPMYYRDQYVAQLWVGPEDDDDDLHDMEDFVPIRPDSISDMVDEEVPYSNRFALKLGFDNVHDEVWDPDEPLGTIAYDQVHEMTLMETWSHPFHMHIYHMQIVTPGGCGAHEEGEFYDTISAPGNCTVRFRTADFGQRCTFHCHVFCHENNPFVGIGVYAEGMDEPIRSGGSMSWVYVVGDDSMPMDATESPEYECPLSTLPNPPPTPPFPTASPTPSPTQSPTTCVPGFLGISTGRPLLLGQLYVNPEFGVYITQQTDGNLVLTRGTPVNKEGVVWSHGGTGNENTTYFTKLNGDSNLVTMSGTPRNEGALVWEAGVVNSNGSYFLGIDCDDIVNIYEGDPSDLRRSPVVSVWNSTWTAAPTTAPAPTSSPTQSPTAPTAAPTSCVPGFLGITSDPNTTLLYRHEYINEDFGVYIRQQGDGNLVVRHGTPEDKGARIWAHGVQGRNATAYFTKLQPDSNLLTLEGSPNDGRRNDRPMLWKSGMVNPKGEYFLGIDCHSEVVSIYAGSPTNLEAAVSVWNSSLPGVSGRAQTTP